MPEPPIHITNILQDFAVVLQAETVLASDGIVTEMLGGQPSKYGRGDASIPRKYHGKDYQQGLGWSQSYGLSFAEE